MLLKRRMMMEGENVMKEWRLLREYTLEEDSRTVVIDQDNEGAPFSVTDFILQVNGVSDATGNQMVHILVNSIVFPNLLTIQKSDANISNGFYWNIAYNTGQVVLGGSASGSYGNVISGVKFSTKILLPMEPLTTIGVQMASASVKIKASAQFILYGR